MINNLSDDIFIKTIMDNISIAGVIISLGYSITGSNYKLIKDRIKKLNINTSHFLGQKHGKTIQKSKISWDKILIEKSPYHLDPSRKKRLIKENFLKNECDICHCKPIWNNKILVLRLDHINGKNRDHRIENLRFICPNCDSQLPTYCGRNKIYQRSINSIGLE